MDLLLSLIHISIADSPFGPFNRIGKILQQDGKVGTGAGHHSVIQITGKDAVSYTHLIKVNKSSLEVVCKESSPFSRKIN